MTSSDNSAAAAVASTSTGPTAATGLIGTTGGTDFDRGPLSWVMSELRESLARTRAKLGEALVEGAEAADRDALLKQARAHLHQAHGALQIVEVDGVAILTETIEDLFDRFDSGQLPPSAEAAQAIDHACTALIEYLEELLAGAPPQTVRLFPYYEALLRVRGAERIHPADLFFPNLAIRPILNVDPSAGTLTAADYVALRKRFEQALLPFLKTAADAAPMAGAGGVQASPPNAHAEQMHQLIGEVARAQSNQQSRAFWWVMRGFAEAVAAGQVPTEVYVKQLFARINLQIRRMSEGSTSIAERVLRDALFFIARVASPSARLQQIRDAYRLDGLVPPDFERKRYGLVDAHALAAARERLGKAKNLWNRIAGGDIAAAAAFEQEMHGLSDAGARLNALPLAKLLRELNGIARAAANARPGDRLGLEMATSLLFVENALGQIGALSGDFSEQADAMSARLLSIVAGEPPAQSTPWLDDISRQAQQRQTIAAVTGELQSSLRQVEKMLEAYFDAPADASALAPVQAILHQVGGALAVLDQEQAAQAVQHVQAALDGFAQAGVAPDAAAAQAQFQQIARTIGALGFFVETLRLPGAGQAGRFQFDPASGVFQAQSIVHGQVLPVQVDDDLSAAATLQAEPASTAPTSSQAGSADMPPATPELVSPLPADAAHMTSDTQAAGMPKQAGQDAGAATALSGPRAAGGDDVLAGADLAQEAPGRGQAVAPASDVGTLYETDAATSHATDAATGRVPDAATSRVTEDAASHAAKDATGQVATPTTTHASEQVSTQTPEPADASPAASSPAIMPDLPTVEDELRRHQHEARDLAQALAADTGNTGLQAQLKQALQQVRRDASLIDHPEANAQVRDVLALLGEEDFGSRPDAGAALLSAMGLSTPDTAADQAPATAVEIPGNDEEIDAELLEIFLGEAVEVLDAVRSTLPAAHREPHNQEHLTTLRRSFHTLKGSGRMVGLMAFGEAAWSVEQVLNLRLSDTRGGDADLFALLDMALETLGRWVDDLQSKGRSDCSPAAIIAAANRLQEGLPPESEAWDAGPVATGHAGAPVASDEAADEAGDEAAEEPEELLLSDAEMQLFHQPAQEDETLRSGVEALAEGVVVPATGQIADAAHADAEANPDGKAEAGADAGAGVSATSEAAAETDADAGSDARSDADTSSDARSDADTSPAADGDAEAEQEAAADDYAGADADMHAGDHALQAPDAPAQEVDAPQAATASVLGFPTLLAPVTQRTDNVKQIGAIEISVALHNIYLAETDALVRLLSLDIDEWRHEPGRAVSVGAVNAAHSLAGTSATVGFKSLQEVAHGLELVLQQLARTPLRLFASEFDILDQVVERIRFMLQLFALSEMAEPEPQEVERLAQLHAAILARADAQAQGGATELSAEMAAGIGMPPPVATLSGTGMPAQADPPAHSDTPARTDDAQAAIPDFAALLSRESVEFDAEPPESAFTDGDPLPAHDDTAATKPEAAFAGAAALDALEADLAPPRSAVALKDDLDADLMPVFIEEANDMLPQIGGLLRDWQQAPADAAAPQGLLRLLHTIKGSARMAGAMRLGQHMHEMESRIEQVMHASHHSPLAMENLLARHDQGLQMFEALLRPQAPAQVEPAPIAFDASATTGLLGDASDAGDAKNASDAKPVDAANAADTANAQAQETGSLLSGGLPERRRAPRLPADGSGQGTPVPLVRVRADILDRLVNQTGEISIARSRLENEVDGMRQSLVELSENIARLRDQLREVEMQAESQIANQTGSQRATAADRQFDPLEFDRFTRLQELTRMMAESVNDVGSVQQNLIRNLDAASDDLGAQARLTRDLQQDLMSVRMVQFASITERLYRVSRQASKEVDKRVSLDIRGGAVEVDRSVLEKMAGPFEHLLRNAIVHGVETRSARQAAGKNEVGELLVEVRQEGNEVVIQFSDDGQGLDLQRIRSKAVQTGLLGADQVLSDAELTDLIFHPGFSTAAEVTELAGRGVGMDVVRAEATALGGRVAIVSHPGRGAQFTVHLPLTLAVTQVVLLTTGGKTYAVPSVLVEQVQQLKAPALAAAYAEGGLVWQSQRVPLAYLATLLGESGTSPVAQQYSPMIILKSGSSRIAIHVDEILGNREVVVKNVGPQLARLAGIAGATVLGSGEIVLILNPLALARRTAPDELQANSANAPLGMQASSVALQAVHGNVDDGASAAGARVQRIVMVVDDSLTVRRVTQRLLSREGYRVVLAKDGVDALEQLQSITPDVMLVDIEMPRMDGFDLTRNVRDDARTRHIPIIMITSRTASKHRNYAFELGVNEYLGKPFQEDMLLSLIAGFVAGETAA